MLTPEESRLLRKHPKIARKAVWGSLRTKDLVKHVPGALDSVVELALGRTDQDRASRHVSDLVGFPVQVTPLDLSGLLADYKKHQGPGPHKGTGTDQSVHGRGTGRINVAKPGSGVGGDYDPKAEYQSDHTSAAKADPAWEKKVLAKVQQLAGFEHVKTLDEAVALMEYNIEQLYERGTQDPDSDLWRSWYPIANELGIEWGAQAEVHPDTSYAIIARLSPQCDWDANLVMAKEVMRIADQDPVISPEIAASAQSLMERINNDRKSPKPVEDLPKILEGKRLSELSPEAAAHVIRSMSEDQGVKLPNGDGFRWQSEYNIAASIDIFRAAKRNEYSDIDGLLGSDMKIRSFYNNLRDPSDTGFGEVTVDTHATGVAIGIPVTTKAREITTSKDKNALLDYDGTRGPLSALNVLGSPSTVRAGVKGMYPLIADAYRNVARRKGVLPREVQSVTWEQWRKEWPPKARDGWMQDTVRGIRHELGHTPAGDAAVEQFRIQLPGVAPPGEGTNQVSGITGGASRWANAYGSGYVFGVDERESP